MTAAENKSSIGSLFRNRVVRTILLSALFLQIGIWVRNYSILLFVMEQTNENPVAVSMISVAEFAPIFLFSFIGGTFADRWRPKRTMIWCDILSALSILAVLTWMGIVGWKAIFFATLVSSILSQFSQPSGMKLFKLHVPQELVQMGMSIYQTLFAVFMILGPVLGTFVYQQFGIYVSIGVMGVAFLLSAASLLMLPPDRVENSNEKAASVMQEMAAGFKYVLGSRALVSLGGCFAAAGLALGLTQPLYVFLVTERLGLPKENLQWLMAVHGVAMITGGALVMGLASKARPQVLLTLGMTVSSLMMLTMGLSTNFALTLTAEFISGLFMPCIHIGINTMILSNTKAEYIGRVNGILNPLFMGAMVLTMSASGWLKEMTSIVTIFVTATVLFGIGIAIMLPLLRLRGTGSSQGGSGSAEMAS
jgi:Na+/melibiose symporter-like transporter